MSAGITPNNQPHDVHPGAAAAPQDTPRGSDHEANGRFARGNKAGRGNPHARQVAALRKALLETVTEQDMIEIAHALMIQAKMGDVAAAKLLIAYTLGKLMEASAT